MSNDNEGDKAPDWWARGGALAGIVLSIIGLVLTYRTNRWQERVYQESLEERIVVHGTAWVNLVKGKGGLKQESDGKLGVEVVNIGMHPIYIKTVVVKIGPVPLTFYEHDPLNPKLPLVKLEPGELATYTVGLDFASFPQLSGPDAPEALDVDVETSKKVFASQANIDRITFASTTLASDDEMQFVPRQKKVK
jgi:hypothetical protein